MCGVILAGACLVWCGADLHEVVMVWWAQHEAGTEGFMKLQGKYITSDRD